MRTAAAAQMVYTLMFVTIWIMLRQPLAMKKFDNQGGQQSKKTEVLQTKKKQYKQIQGWDLLVGYYKSMLDALSPYSKKIKNVIMSNWLVRNIFISFYALSQYQSGFLSILMFVVATFLGNFVGVQWYTIHLFDIFTSFSQLTNIFKAILNNFKKLALLSFLAGVFILVFNVVSLNTYTPVIWQQDLPQEACQDIIGCVLQLYTSGAVGEDMQQFAPQRFIFDIVFTVFMEIMFQNIVSGIMIDSFSELKEEDAARDQDKKTLCYICGMDKPSMERQGSTFDKHIKNRHFLWNYLYYLYCLRLKSPTDFTGLEYEIDLKVKQEDVEWFPALGQADSGGQTQKVITELQENVKQVFEYLDNSISSSKTTFDDAMGVVDKIKIKKSEIQEIRNRIAQEFAVQP